MDPTNKVRFSNTPHSQLSNAPVHTANSDAVTKTIGVALVIFGFIALGIGIEPILGLGAIILGIILLSSNDRGMSLFNTNIHHEHSLQANFNHHPGDSPIHSQLNNERSRLRSDRSKTRDVHFLTNTQSSSISSNSVQPQSQITSTIEGRGVNQNVLSARNTQSSSISSNSVAHQSQITSGKEGRGVNHRSSQNTKQSLPQFETLSNSNSDSRGPPPGNREGGVTISASPLPTLAREEKHSPSPSDNSRGPALGSRRN